MSRHCTLCIWCTSACCNLSARIDTDVRQPCVPAGDSHSISGHCSETYEKVIGEPPSIITDRWTLREVEHHLRFSELKRHIQAGVTFRDSDYGTHLSTGLQIGRDTVIGVGVQIYGKTVIGR